MIISSSSPRFSTIYTPIVVTVTNPIIGAPAGSVNITTQTNGYTPSALTTYVDTFGNVIVPAGFSSTNNSIKGWLIKVDYSSLGAPAGTYYPTVTSNYVTVPGSSGDYYIDTNACGPVLVLSNLFTITTLTTNVLYSITNSAGFVNSAYL